MTRGSPGLLIDFAVEVKIASREEDNFVLKEVIQASKKRATKFGFMVVNVKNKENDFLQNLQIGRASCRERV